MKKLLRLLFKERMGLLFMIRMQSIERQIIRAAENVSYPLLASADQRLKLEKEYSHNSLEWEEIKSMFRKLAKAKKIMEQTLKSECQLN